MTKRALIIANASYDHPADFRELPSVRADATGMRAVLEDPAIGGFTVTIEADRTYAHVRNAIGEFFRTARHDDFLLLHISAHGLRHDGSLRIASRDSTLAGSDTDNVSAKFIAKRMLQSRARRILLLIDCCYSGAFPQSGLLRGGRGPAGLPRAEEFGGGGTGRMVITASYGWQTSWEPGDPARPSLFTAAVIDALRSGAGVPASQQGVRVRDLYHAIDRAMRGVRDDQQPTLSIFQAAGEDVVVALNPRRDPDLPEAPSPGRQRRLALLRCWAGAVAAWRRLRRLVTRVEVQPRWRRAAGMIGVSSLLWALPIANQHVDTTVCGQPAEVRVVTTGDLLSAYQQVARAYELWTAGRHGGCRTARLSLYAQPAEVVRAGLAAGWWETSTISSYLRDVGPHPDVWLPDSAPDLTGLAMVESNEVVAESPLVLAVPTARVDLARDESLRAGGLTWPKLLRKAVEEPVPGGGTWGLVRPDPAVSAVGELATSALYQGMESAAMVRTQVEQWIERSHDQGGYPPGGLAALLCRQRELGAGGTSIVLPEVAMIRFNRGEPFGGPCGVPASPVTGGRLLAFYPDDTLKMELPAIRIRWTGGVQTQLGRAYARDFVEWMLGRRGYQAGTVDDRKGGPLALLAAGLRARGWAGEPGEEADGALPGWPFGYPLDPPPSAQRREQVRQLHAAAQRPARVMLALDVSGSMSAATSDPQVSRLDAALLGLDGLLEQMGTRDEFGLLAFSDGVSTPIRVLAPISARDAVAARVLRDRAAQELPKGNTPLYAAISAAVDAARTGEPVAADHAPLRAVVVLTDGHDTSGAPPPVIRPEWGVRIFVLAVGEASCADPALAALAQQSAGECVGAPADRMAEELVSMFSKLWEG